MYIFCIQEDDDDVWQTCEISQVKNMIKKLKIKICYTANDCNAIGNLELIQSKNINSFCGLGNKISSETDIQSKYTRTCVKTLKQI